MLKPGTEISILQFDINSYTGFKPTLS